MNSSAPNEKRQAAPSENQQPLKEPVSELGFDDSVDVEFWEEQMAESDNIGQRIGEPTDLEGKVQAGGREQLDDDLALESHAQTGGDRSVQKVQSEGKSTARSKNPTGQRSPKRANPETHSDYGAAERRAGGDGSQGITAHKRGEEDSRQEKVVAIRNDAKAAGRRTGFKSKAS